jgi:hypothetical protein
VRRREQPLALVLHDRGQSLFGSAWSASPDQRRRWNTLVVNDGGDWARGVSCGPLHPGSPP